MSEVPRPFKPIKRIITGHNEKGQSTTIFVDEPGMKRMRPQVPTLTSNLWLTLETPINNDDSK